MNTPCFLPPRTGRCTPPAAINRRVTIVGHPFGRAVDPAALPAVEELR